MYNPKKVGFRGYDLLGDVYYYGCARAGLDPDKGAALTWYQNAALAHVPESQWKLGRMLYHGEGVEPDREKGLQWITSAAIEGSADASSFLLSVGEPVPEAVSPNTYETAARTAELSLRNAQAEGRRAVFQDLGDLLLTGVAIATSAYANQAISSSTNQRNYANTPVRVTRFRPVYCQYQATANTYYTNAVNVRITQMCR